MAIPTWPLELPQYVLREGYSEGVRDGRLATRTSAGPGKMRRRFSSAVIPVQARIFIGYAGKSRLERFWNEETSGGVLPFILPDQSHNGIGLMNNGNQLVINNANLPIITYYVWLAMFSPERALEFTPLGARFEASFQLNVLP